MPCVIIRRRSDCSSAEYELTLHEIWLATGENGTIIDKEFPGNVRIGYHNGELVTHPNREQRSELFGPGINREFRMLPKECVTQKWTGGDRIPISINKIFGKEDRQEEIDRSRNPKDESDLDIHVGIF